jgi:hypothetical protein
MKARKILGAAMRPKTGKIDPFSRARVRRSIEELFFSAVFDSDILFIRLTYSSAP